MNPPGPRSTWFLPHGVKISVVIGAAGGATGWLLTGIVSQLTTSFSRLDQLVALVVGAAVGVSVLGARALRQRRGVAFHAGAGLLLGGVGALTGASVLAFVRGPVAPAAFLAERVAAWAITAACAAFFLAAFVNPRNRAQIAESVWLAAIGGAIAGVVFTFPGASDVWQAVAVTWFGATIGFAVAGPELWGAAATIELLPGRGVSRGLLTVREWPLHDGDLVGLGEAQVACSGRRIALYPPARGVVSSGRSVREPAFLDASGTLAVGRTRYQVTILGAP